MTRLIEAGETLAETLARENAALDAMDFAAATALYPRKDAATAAFENAQRQAGMIDALDEEQRRLARELAERLRRLIEENRRLLERAIHVQGHVIGTVARAMAQAPRANAPRYAATGHMAAVRRQPSVVLSSRA
jgi:hypothetical protein